MSAVIVLDSSAAAFLFLCRPMLISMDTGYATQRATLFVFLKLFHLSCVHVNMQGFTAELIVTPAAGETNPSVLFLERRTIPRSAEDTLKIWT